MKKFYPFIAFLLLLLGSCREDEALIVSNSTQVTLPLVGSEVKGFYQLNEGNMGMNHHRFLYPQYLFRKKPAYREGIGRCRK